MLVIGLFLSLYQSLIKVLDKMAIYILKIPKIIWTKSKKNKIFVYSYKNMHQKNKYRFQRFLFDSWENLRMDSVQ